MSRTFLFQRIERNKKNYEPQKSRLSPGDIRVPILSRLQSLENAEAIGIVTVHGVHERRTPSVCRRLDTAFL